MLGSKHDGLSVLEYFLAVGNKLNEAAEPLFGTGAALCDGERLYLSPSTAWCSLRPTWHERLAVRRGYWLRRDAG